MIFCFHIILRRRIHEDQNQGMKDMHPWNVDFAQEVRDGLMMLLN